MAFLVVMSYCSACSDSMQRIQLDKLPDKFSLESLQKEGFTVEVIGYTLENKPEYKIHKSSVGYSIGDWKFNAGFTGYTFDDGKWSFFYITNCDSSTIDSITHHNEKDGATPFVLRYNLSSAESVREYLGEEIVFDSKAGLKFIVNRRSNRVYVAKI